MDEIQLLHKILVLLIIFNMFKVNKTLRDNQQTWSLKSSQQVYIYIYIYTTNIKVVPQHVFRNLLAIHGPCQNNSWIRVT